MISLIPGDVSYLLSVPVIQAAFLEICILLYHESVLDILDFFFEHLLNYLVEQKFILRKFLIDEVDFILLGKC